jgi:hypothetical protein
MSAPDVTLRQGVFTSGKWTALPYLLILVKCLEKHDGDRLRDSGGLLHRRLNTHISVVLVDDVRLTSVNTGLEF